MIFFFQFTSYFALNIQSFLLNSLFVFVLFNSLLGKQTPLAFTNNQPLDLAFLLTVLMKHAKNKYSVKTLYTFRPENYLKNAHILFLVKEIRIQCTKRKCKLMLLAAEYFKVKWWMSTGMLCSLTANHKCMMGCKKPRLSILASVSKSKFTWHDRYYLPKLKAYTFCKLKNELIFFRKKSKLYFNRLCITLSKLDMMCI